MIGYYGFEVRLFACIFIAGLIILVVTGIIAIARFLKRHDVPPPAEWVIRILDERYARGEITREEYRRMRIELGRGWGKI